MQARQAIDTHVKKYEQPLFTVRTQSADQKCVRQSSVTFATTRYSAHVHEANEEYPPNMVMDKILLRLFTAEILQRIGPKDVAHQSVGWRFTESVDLRWPKSHPNSNRVSENVQYPTVTGSKTDGRVALTDLRSSRVLSSGLNPPWMQRNCLFMIAAKGRQQNDSMHAS